jgi:hypothetical protein
MKDARRFWRKTRRSGTLLITGGILRRNAPLIWTMALE